MAAAEGQAVRRAFGHGFEQLAGSSLAEEMYLIGHYLLKCNVTASEKYCTDAFSCRRCPVANLVTALAVSLFLPRSPHEQVAQ